MHAILIINICLSKVQPPFMWLSLWMSNSFDYYFIRAYGIFNYWSQSPTVILNLHTLNMASWVDKILFPTPCLRVWFDHVAYFSLLEFARTNGNGLPGQFALLCVAIKTTSWSCRSQNDKRHVKQTWNQLQIKPSPAKAGPANQHTCKREINVYFCMPQGLGLVFMVHYYGNNWMTKTKQLISRGKKGNRWFFQMYLPYTELLCWVTGTEATRGTGFSDPLTADGSEEARDIFWWFSHTSGLISTSLLCRFCLHLSQEA